MSHNNNIEPTVLTQKELKDQELVALHKDVLLDYINQYFTWNSVKKAQVIILYDNLVDRDNIRQYYNYHVGLFLLAMLQNKLEDIANYTMT